MSTPNTVTPAPSRKKKTASPSENGEVSKVLRSVYQRTVDEDIPSEMLDLLNRLG